MPPPNEGVDLFHLPEEDGQVVFFRYQYQAEVLQSYGHSLIVLSR